LYYFFWNHEGLAEYEEKRPTLVLYKASMRNMLAQGSNSRYTPQLRFQYDEAFEKQQKIDILIEKLKMKAVYNESFPIFFNLGFIFKRTGSKTCSRVTINW